MDLSDTERYATAALFSLALHCTHVECGVDRNGNSLSESEYAWGCPGEELFDEQLLSQVPLKLPPEVLDVFWGFDCMAPAGLAPRLYAWLKVPRKAWPGLMRLPDVAGNAGSPHAVEAFVTLVRRYSAFLDPALDFTTGQASRLQQHFVRPAAAAAAPAAVLGGQEEETAGSGAQDAAGTGGQPSSAAKQQQQLSGSSASGAAAAAGEQEQPVGALLSGFGSLGLGRHRQQRDKKSEEEDDVNADGACGAATGSSMPVAEAAAAAAASLSAAALAAEAASSAGGAAPLGARDDAPAAAGPALAAASSSSGAANTPAARTDAAAATAAAFEALHEAVDVLPREADEGSVLPTATFAPAEHYNHTTSHKSVLALYELIGGCVASNTRSFMEPLLEMAARDAQHAAAAAAAAKAGRKPPLPPGVQLLASAQQQQPAGGQEQQQQQHDSEAAHQRPAAAWFPADAGQPQVKCTDGPSSSAGATTSTTSTSSSSSQPTSSSKQPQQQQQQQHDKPEHQQQQLLGLAAVQWYDSRARVAVKRVAHWLRVPFSQVRAFERMWAAALLELDPDAAKPRFASSSKAAQYLKVGAAAVGGGALLAVTGGLAAPAIAAGLGAAVTLAHGGAAAAAAVAGFAGSTAGTAAVTGLFGAWGASVGGGAASERCAGVTEFGFWDLSASVYTDGKGPAAAAAAKEQQQPEEEGQQQVAAPTAAAAAAAVGAASAAGGSLQDAAATAGGAKAPPASSQQQGSGSSSILYRLFSPRPDGLDSSSSAKQPQQQAAATVAASGDKATDDSAAAAPCGTRPQQKMRLRDSAFATDSDDDDDAKQFQRECQQQQQQAARSPAALPAAVSKDAPAAAAPAAPLAAAPHAAASTSSSAAAGAASGSGGVLGGLFARSKEPPPPLYVPLLLTPVNPRHRGEAHIALTIAVNGCCIERMEDFTTPWAALPSRDCDRFALVWESACLRELGRAVVAFIAQQALTQVAQRSIQAFLYTGLVGALALPMTLTTAMRVAFGSKWLVALRRAQAAGKMLALLLAQRCHGGRPVTLIGCSMGARLVFHCLLELERMGVRGCVENAILLGSPLSCRPDRWCAARSVVAGRLINGYSVNDWTLGLLYRVHSSSSIWLQAAGMYKVDVPGVENINLSKLISGHQDYLTAMDDILDVINLNEG